MKIKILLVDDESEFVDTLAERLEARNFNTSVAYSGDNALELCKNHEFDIIILDVLMPGIGGIETLKCIKKMLPLVQVIMLTGNATVGNAILGMKHGAYDFLMKPIEIEELLQKINDAFNIKLEHENRIRQAEIENIVNRRGW